MILIDEDGVEDGSNAGAVATRRKDALIPIENQTVGTFEPARNAASVSSTEVGANRVMIHAPNLTQFTQRGSNFNVTLTLAASYVGDSVRDTPALIDEIAFE